MSFLDSSSCGAGANPLAQMVKQINTDHSLQFDRSQAAPGSSSFRNPKQVAQHDRAMMESFENGRNEPFAMNDIRNELPQLHRQPEQANWAQDFRSSQPANGQWAREFQPEGNYQMHASGAGSSTMGHPGPSASAMRSPMAMPNYMMSGQPMNSFSQPMMYGNMPQNMPQQHQQAPGQNIDDAAWEQQFKSMEQSVNKPSVEKEVAAEEPLQAETTQTKEQLDEDRELGIEDGVDPNIFAKQSEYPPNWDEVWDKIKGDVNSGGEVQDRSDEIWDRDFNQFASNRPQFGEYTFATENPHLNEEDPFSMGVRLMDNGAKLSIASLCFEAAIQRNPEHVEAWTRLGDCQAQNELEDQAIKALEHATKLDPRNEKALMSLAVSYINEGYENAAYASLERWLATKYPDLCNQATSDNPALSNEDRLQLHDRVANLFIRAAQMSPETANMDADVQMGLGVLFYGNEEYDKAVDCFRAALSVRPNDPLLWNRLGATLANSNKPEEGISAYYKALELRPSFVRARYNLSVSCINIGCLREAAEHLLSSMTLHETSSDDKNFEKSTNLCDTLSRVFLAMDRRDLVNKVGPKMNLDEFREEFSF